MIYEAKCRECGKVTTYSRSVSERDSTPKCCDKPMERIFSPTPGKVDVPAYRR